MKRGEAREQPFDAACASAVRGVLGVICEDHFGNDGKRTVAASVYDPSRTDARRLIVTVSVETIDF